MNATTETIEITDLPSGTIKALSLKAQSFGQTTTDYLRNLIEADLVVSRSFDEILAPIRQGFQQSGLREDELEALFEEAREEVWQQKQARKQ